jgi:hypothetical protein
VLGVEHPIAGPLRTGWIVADLGELGTLELALGD